MQDVMLDLETMGNTINAAIIQIGVCEFDRETAEIGSELLLNVELASSMAAGFTADASTIEWWLKQSEAARESVMAWPRIDIYNALCRLNDFYLGKAKRIWSHATFDFVIVMNALHKIGIKPSFHYRSARDIRTLTDLAKLDTRKERCIGIQHNALDDCRFQVSYVVKCLNKLKERK